MRVVAFAAVLLVVAAALPARAQSDPPRGETIWVEGATHRLKARAYFSPAQSEHPQLVVVLHGDAPFNNPSYQYRFARLAAEQGSDLVAVGLLRPGYTDGEGDKSDGERGRTTGDNYTPDVIADVIAAVQQLRTRFAARSVVLVGHSGGAAIVADAIGTAPDLANGALLVSCPCDLPRFRRHMAWQQWSPFWLLPVDSLSPLDLVPQVRRDVKVRLVVGGDDDIAPADLSQRYEAALRARNDDVTVAILPGLPHDILLEPQTFAALAALLKTTGTP